MTASEKLVGRFYDGDRVRHRRTDRTGTVIGVSRKGRYYMLIDWDDRDRNKIVDLWTWWPPTSFALLSRLDKKAEA